MRLLGRLVVFAVFVEVGCWVLATAVRPGSWRYNISDLYAAGAPRPLLVMTGEATFALGLAVLALGLRRSLPRTDHRAVGCTLLVLASLGTMAGALARNSCEESVPRCDGDTFATTADWVHGIGALLEILGIAGAAIVLAAVLPRPWATYSATTGAAAFGILLGWAAVPYPWVGTAERILALVLVAWAAVMGSRLAIEHNSTDDHRRASRSGRGSRHSRPDPATNGMNL